MVNRRHFLKRSLGATLFAGLPGPLETFARSLPSGADEDAFWASVQRAFTVERSIVHLNNGGVCPSPRVVQEAEVAIMAEAQRGPFYAFEGQVTPQVEAVRDQLARHMGCSVDEVAFMRNTSEAMETVQFGLSLDRGDEIVTTMHDYPRMLRTWEQRSRRDGVVVRKVPVPVPLANPEDLVGAIVGAITPRTRLVMCCHMVDLTGQVLPVRAIADAAHARGVPVLVDGAQTFGHLPFTMSDLDCDYFATSLHKWMMGPQGTGALYIRKDRIADVWSLMSSDASASSDIRKFEDIGTSPPSRILALADAMAFHAAIGSERKRDRLVALRNHWLGEVMRYDRVRLLTNIDAAGALATISIDGIDPLDLRNHLWDRHRIRVRPIRQENVSGIRVSAGIYNTFDELDHLLAVLEPIIRFGI